MGNSNLGDFLTRVLSLSLSCSVTEPSAILFSLIKLTAALWEPRKPKFRKYSDLFHCLEKGRLAETQRKLCWRDRGQWMAITFLSSPLEPAKNCCKRIFRKYWNCFVNKGGYQYSKGLSNWFACYEELSKKTPDIVIVSFEKYLLQLCKVNLTLRRNCQQIPFFPISLVWAASMLSRYGTYLSHGWPLEVKCFPIQLVFTLPVMACEIFCSGSRL